MLTLAAYTNNNSEAIAESALALCAACGEIVPAQDIDYFLVTSGGLSARCPLCNSVAIIPSASGFPMDDLEACDKVRKEWKSCHALQK